MDRSRFLPRQPPAARRVRRRRPIALAAAGAALLAASAGSLLVASQGSASADAAGPPAYSSLTNCPVQQYPAAGYTGTYLDHTNPANVQNNLGSGKIGYLIPFRGTIGRQKGVDGSTVSDAGGEVVLPATSPGQPAVIVPHIYGAVCGLISLPELKGYIFPTNIVLGSVNAYIGSQPEVHQVYPDAVEALPLSLTFGTLSAGVVPTPAHNGGLDVTLTGSNSATISLDGTPGATPNALGTACPLKLNNVTFSTLDSAKVNGLTVAGQPVTGPVMNGQAEVVSNTFAVPAVATSATCPAIIAQTVNRFFGLPLPAGRAVFVAPFTFDFEINQ